MKRFLIFITLFALLLTCATLAINAEEIALEEGYYEEYEAPSDVSTSEKDIAVIAEAVKEWIFAHLTEIGSGLTLLVSGVLAWLYKKGVLPNIVNGFNGISKVLTAFKDKMLEQVAQNRSDVNKAVGELNKAINIIAEMKESYDNLQQLYAGQEQEKTKLEAKVKRSDDINLLTCKMIKELFVNTNVPQYIKDDVNTYYANTIALINQNEEKTVTTNEAA